MSWGDFFGGAAAAGAGLIERNIAADRALEDRKAIADYQSELEAKRMEVIEALRVKREAADQAKLMEQSDKVDEAATASRSKQNLSGLINTQSGIGGSSPNATPAELEALLADPKNRKIYEDAGYIPKAGASDLARDKVDAARSIGADPRLRKEYAADHKSALDAERNAVIEALKKREADRKEAADAHRFEVTSKQATAQLMQANAAMRRAEKSGDAQAATDAKTSATQVMNAVRAQLEEMTKPGTGSISIEDGKPVGSPEAVAEYTELKKLSRAAVSALNLKFDNKAASAGGPAVGTVVNGYKFKGGNPNDKNNWVK